ncbi:lysosome-associated membrane glycoprotein 3 isoform X2 [Micropterus dolomieu]|nr:lysosome-associated membrane glycoprotein 3 isoform X2 [Micropterus dolomieu]XP_045904537.1 lysosome-associated membrane glycoprotein 3 isoform X2 [Micropterus dolomieu]XP_045904538.1 lysosome-associated membrane glycoprotein 3 isoform X2 [Micropterus dolomieu]XP_045904539.1 lysosome-associated membrane glycoprotein 3 isoform X2 [Micropterus dolomieu]XP_045904540.1 lysosome-associated membrane glycoprotein 3 isoform X2 [Micropterus dolomieu]XP_045904541.1 lysosome-associated membrane glycop
MMLRGPTGEWFLFFLAAIIPGLHLQRNGSSIQPASNSEPPSKAQIYQPVFQPSEAIPPIGTYMLKNAVGNPCIKATMGVEYIVIEKKKSWYFNLDPSRVSISGYCSKETAVLSLTLPANAASLQLFFKKENNLFYVTKLTAHVSPLPVCQGCANKTYSGLVDHEKLFTAANGQSFNCKSENLLLMSPALRIKLVPLQMQAFTLPKGQYGKEVECWADYNKRVIPIVIGATVVCLILIAVLTFLFIKDRRRQGYDRI